MIGPPQFAARWWLGIAGGPARARVLFLLALVLGLDTADLGTVGSVAGELERALGLSNAELGLLAAVPSICAAVATLPAGMLADRTNRVRALWVGMLAWSAAQGLSAAAGSFETLLLIRLALGAATAVAAPAVASLVGDLFPAEERGRIWGLILGGELVGSAFGYVIAGEVASFGADSWRLAFIVLAVPSAVGAYAVKRHLREPARGGAGQLARGATRIPPPGEPTPPVGAGTADTFAAGRVQEEVRDREVEPIREQILRSDPERMSLPTAARHVLRVRTNIVLIIASALGYFYFTGISTFGLVYFQDRFRLAHGAATISLGALAVGGLVGVVGGGRLADRGLRHGRVNSRIWVGASSLAIATMLFLPGLLVGSLVVALPIMTVAATAFAARNPPLDAARLDIMHHRLWGRAESIRTLLRRTMTASAPIVFGVLADALAAPRAGAAASGAHGFGANANGRGLELASLVLLAAPALGSLCTYIAIRTYPRDVATAIASEAATDEEQDARPAAVARAARARRGGGR